MAKEILSNYKLAAYTQSPGDQVKYSADIQVGYYDDDLTYHGPFPSSGTFEAESGDAAVLKAYSLRDEAMAALLEAFPQGYVLRIHDQAGGLVYDHAAGIVRPVLLTPEPPTELIQLAPRLTAQILKYLKQNPRELHSLRPR